MAQFMVEQYELHVATYKVVRDTEAEAIAEVLGNGDAEQLDFTEYIGVHDDMGMTPSSELQKKLEGLGITLQNGKVASIRCVYEKSV